MVLRQAPKYHWIDNFHTGYNLDSLKRYIDSTNETEFSAICQRGYKYFKHNFFESDGRTKYMHDRLLPIDIQCAAQAIDTLSLFSSLGPWSAGPSETCSPMDDHAHAGA